MHISPLEQAPAAIWKADFSREPDATVFGHNK
jgi:hypothetical protein